MLELAPDAPDRADVRSLLDEHLADMFATSPAESVHALDAGALAGPAISFWTARDDGELLACGALKDRGAGEAELKSMRTAGHARGRGIGGQLLGQLLAEARRLGFHRVSLETGSQEYFAAARRLYLRHGFTVCPPFADYQPDPNSVFMTLDLAET